MLHNLGHKRNLLCVLADVSVPVPSDDPDEVMPPRKSKKSLTDEQKNLIKLWIEQGGQWNDHWSFNAPVKPKLPQVKNKDWGKNPIDAFILRGLEQRNLAPSPEASAGDGHSQTSLSLRLRPAGQHRKRSKVDQQAIVTHVLCQFTIVN